MPRDRPRYAPNVGRVVTRWEMVLAALEPPDALRLACYLLRGHATDSELCDTLSDNAAEFFDRASLDDAQAARIIEAIEAHGP